MGRKDGTLLRKLPGFRKMFPFLITSRQESTIYYRQTTNVEKTLVWLAAYNAKHGTKLSIFYVFLAAIVRGLATMPDANRFVVGRRIYQRNEIVLTFVVKRALTTAAGETTLKLRFDPNDSFDDTVKRVHSAIEKTKASTSSGSEGISNTLTRMPRFMTRIVMWFVGVLDYFNLLPASFIKSDPFYASVFLANLGSIELDPVLHHLYEYGTIPFFAVVGQVKKAPWVVEGEDGQPDRLEVRRVVESSYTLDERTTDGVYYAKIINKVLEFVADPTPLESPPGELPDPMRLA